MPSINRPTWRGVSTTGIDHIAEELSRLERSTILMRQNLDNANANRINNSSETLRIDDCDAIAGVTEAVSIENEDLSSVLQSLETSSEELKLKIRSALKSNAEIKLEMKTYLEQSEAWNLTFEQESKKIDAEIEAVTSLTSLEKESVSEGKLTTIIASKARSWYNVLGIKS